MRSPTLTAALVTAALFAAPTPAWADDAAPLFALVDAAAQRLQVADDVAAVKWLTGAAIEDPVRVGQQLEKLSEDAAEDQLDPGYVRRVFADQIAATEGAEHYRFAQWKLHPDAAPVAAPELAESRARIDGFNKAMLVQIGRQWQLLHSPDCPGQLRETTRAVSDAQRLDEFYRQALSSATQAYCAR